MEPKTKRKKYADQPHDLQSVVNILQRTGIEKFESNVPHMLLEFAHTFTQEILDESREFSKYAGRPQKIDVADVQLAVQGYNEKYFTRPLPVSSMKGYAAAKNSVPIPQIPASSSTAILWMKYY